jgi:4-hydroxybenzoate polyprenyltransferase
MFAFLGVSLAALCTIYWFMYRHAISRKAELRLDDFEIYQTETWALVWLGSVAVCLFGVGLAFILEGPWIPFAGFSFALLGVWIPWIHRRRDRDRPSCSR